jgi:SAM-dependent methyltransferase
MSTRFRSSSAEIEYRPFPDEPGRNQRQETLEVPVLVRALQISACARVLEVGCGRGIALPALWRLCRPQRLVGLDIDGGLLAVAQTRLPDPAVELVCGDVRALPFADASFDLVIDFGTLYHVARAADGLREIARVLSAGGRFIEETTLSQLLSHPQRSFGRAVPWEAEPALLSEQWAGLWMSRRRMTAAACGAGESAHHAGTAQAVSGQ